MITSTLSSAKETIRSSNDNNLLLNKAKKSQNFAKIYLPSLPCVSDLLNILHSLFSGREEWFANSYIYLPADDPLVEYALLVTDQCNVISSSG